MKFSKLIKTHPTEVVFLSLITLFFILYFIAYLTPSRIAWYIESREQIVVLLKTIIPIWR